MATKVIALVILSPSFCSLFVTSFVSVPVSGSYCFAFVCGCVDSFLSHIFAKGKFRFVSVRNNCSADDYCMIGFFTILMVCVVDSLRYIHYGLSSHSNCLYDSLDCESGNLNNGNYFKICFCQHQLYLHPHLHLRP